MLHELLNRCGIYYARRCYMPRGVDWLWDLRRLRVGGDTPMVFDVGANEGQTTSQVLRCFPAAIVHAFEPVRDTFNILKRKCGARSGVHINQFAVSDRCGSASILASSNSQLSHLVTGSATHSEGGAQVETVETTSVDAYCFKNGITHIDILKTDTEGHDVPVLRGAEKTLRAGSVDWVLVEVTFDASDNSHSHCEMVQTLLTEYGMALYCSYDHYFTHEDWHHLFCNALFVRKALSIGRAQ